MLRKQSANKITIEEVRAYRAAMTSSKEASIKFLERAGILEDGKITPPYKENKTKISYRYD